MIVAPRLPFCVRFFGQNEKKRLSFYHGFSKYILLVIIEWIEKPIEIKFKISHHATIAGLTSKNNNSNYHVYEQLIGDQGLSTWLCRRLHK